MVVGTGEDMNRRNWTARDRGAVATLAASNHPAGATSAAGCPHCRGGCNGPGSGAEAVDHIVVGSAIVGTEADRSVVGPGVVEDGRSSFPLQRQEVLDQLRQTLSGGLLECVLRGREGRIERLDRYSRPRELGGVGGVGQPLKV